MNPQPSTQWEGTTDLSGVLSAKDVVRGVEMGCVGWGGFNKAVRGNLTS